MKIRTFTVFFWVFLIAAAAVASEERETRIDIAVDGDNLDVMKIHDDGEHGDVTIKKTKNVRVIKGGAETAHRRHEVRVIRKEIDATN